MSDQTKKYFCPRLLDYVILVGPKESTCVQGNPQDEGDVSQNEHQVAKEQYRQQAIHNNRVPHLLRRFPPEDHEDFSLPPDVVIFCQPEGCDHVKSSLNAYNNPSQTTNSFVFLLTEKDTSRIRYGVCLNFYRPLQKCLSASKFKSTSSSTYVKTTSAENQKQKSCPVENAERQSCSSSELRDSNGIYEDQTHEDRCSQSTQDNESGIKVSLGPDSDSYDSSRQQTNPQPYINQRRSPNDQRCLNRSTTCHKHDSSKIIYALNSLCIISHHPFFSTFRECLFIMKKFIQACDERHLNKSYTDKQPTCGCYMKHHRRSSHMYRSCGADDDMNMVHNHHFSCPYANPIWSLMTMPDIDDDTMSKSMLSDIVEIESWILRLLSVPVPVPGKTKVELDIMPASLKQPLLFALPDHTRLSLIDFPLHLPLELLGVETCLQVLTCIILEHKVALQSKDYNALSMSVMAFVTMIYPLEYMFPVIPLLPSYMSSAEQLLLAPTPFIIGFPSSFFKYRSNFALPNDVWIVDLDANKVKRPSNVEDLPPLPEYEGTILVQNLQKILDSMSRGINETAVPESVSQASLHSGSSGGRINTYQPSNLSVKMNQESMQSSTPSSPFRSRRSSVQAAGQLLQFAANKLNGNPTASNDRLNQFKASPSSSKKSSIVINNLLPRFNPLSILSSNDLDSVDVAVRVCMVNFFNSQEVLANFVEHTRTIRLYPRPVVSFQKSSFLQSRAKLSQFLIKLVDTQSVEYLAEWALCPDNVAFQRIQTGVFDPAVIGDKPKWYGNQLELLRYQISDAGKMDFYEEISSLIRESSGIGTGIASNASKFSHFFENNIGLLDEENIDRDYYNIDENNNDNRQPLSRDYQYERPANTDDQESQSSCISSNIPVASESAAHRQRLHQLGVHHHSNDGGSVVLSLNDAINMQMRRSSSSVSTSSEGSEPEEEQIAQTIPASYQHELLQFPKIRSDIDKIFKPCGKLISSMHEARKWMGIEGDPVDSIDKDDPERVSSCDSSALDENENLSRNVADDSSSCDESGTEEFNFDSIRPVAADQTPEILELNNELRLFESVDSDTIMASRYDLASVASHGKLDFTDNSPECAEHTLQESVIQDIQIDSNQDQLAHQSSHNPTSDTMSTIINTQKMRVSTGVAKLLDRASSISDSKFIKNASQASSLGETQSPLPKNIGGEQMGAFFDRFTSEARDKVKEAKAALDAGKAVIKTTALPAADASRQKLLKNLQNIGDSLFEDRRESNASTFDRPSSPDQAQEDKIIKSAQQEESKSSQGRNDLNELAGKANSMISGWLGSKATGFANKVRDRARPFGPFPSIDQNHNNLSPQPNEVPRRTDLLNSRRSSMIGTPSFIKPRLSLLRHSALNQTIDETQISNNGESEFFAGQKLVQKTRLIRHSTELNDQPERSQPVRTTQQSDGDNRQFIKEVTSAVMKGEGIGWLKFNRLKKLMEDENYRDLVLTQINQNASTKIRPDDRVSDIQIPHGVWKGMQKVCLAIVAGLEQSYMHNKLGGMASVFSLLEVAHTHYWTREPSAERTTLPGRQQDLMISESRKSASNSISTMSTDDHNEDELKSYQSDRLSEKSSSSAQEGPTPSSQSDQNSTEPTSGIASGEAKHSTTEMIRLDQIAEQDSSASGNLFVSKDVDLHKNEREERFNTKNLSEVLDLNQGLPQLDQATLAKGVTLASLDCNLRFYLYDCMVKKDRSPLWDQVQFWEEAFLDAVSHERCLVGMDQGPDEMLERYRMLYEVDRKRLEHEEDRLLSTILYNMVAFMVMLRVNHQLIKQKIRRLLGKCHIGLVNSAEINQLLEKMEALEGNDIDLKPMASRQQRRQTFTLHKGTDASGEVIFMEIRDDGLVLRGLDGVIIERWWYERLINMTYSPRNKVVCFWRRSDGETTLNKYYTKKCQELYQSIKESMQKAAANQGSDRACAELGGEFPVLDMKSGEGGILQVCLEGVGLLFATSRYFIRLENIRKCFTQKGETFVIEEYNPKTRQLSQNHFKSQMADQICYAVLCVFSYVAAGQRKSAIPTTSEVRQKPRV